MNKLGETVFIADPNELEIARMHYVDFFAHKIRALRKFLTDLGSEKISESAVIEWLGENCVTDEGLKLLLVNEIKHVSSSLSDIVDRCRRIINHRYRVELIEQYQHLITAVFYTNLEKQELEIYRNSISAVIRHGLWINGRKIIMQDDFTTILLGSNQDCRDNLAIRDFLDTHLYRCFDKAKKYFSDNIDGMQLLLGGDDTICVSTYVEYDSTNKSARIYFVQSYRDLYTLNNENIPENFTGYHTLDNNSPVIAQSTMTFLVKLNEAHQCEIELIEGFLEFYDSSHKDIMVKRLSERCSSNIVFDERKRPLVGRIPSENDGIVIDRHVRDCLNISDINIVKKRLVESSSALKIFLVARRSEAVLWEVLQTYELLKIICSDPKHREYLELLANYHCRNSQLISEISLLLDRLRLVNEIKLSSSDDYSMIKSYLCKEHRYELQSLAALPKPKRESSKTTISIESYGNGALRYSLFANTGDLSGEYVSGDVPSEKVRHIYNTIADLQDEEKLSQLLPCVLRQATQNGHIRIENPLYIIVALLVSQAPIPSLDLLVKDDEIRSMLEMRWIIDLAIQYGEIAGWFVSSGTILNSEVKSQDLCSLLKSNPALWEIIQRHPDQKISLMLRRHIKSRDYRGLLLDNRDRESLRMAKKAMCNDPDLFENLCSLKEKHPNELLTYFYRTFLDYSIAWEMQYKNCEAYLLEYCDKEVIEGYYRRVFSKRENGNFCNLFELMYFKNDKLNGTTKSLECAKKAWIRILEGRCKKGWDASPLYDTQEKIAGIIQKICEEPRLICLFKIDGMIPNYLSLSSSNVLSFIDLYVKNYYKLEFFDVQWVISTLKMLSAGQLRDFLLDPSNSIFFINLIIKDINAVNVLIEAKIDSDSEIVTNVLAHLCPQLILLLMIALITRQNSLKDKLRAYNTGFPTISTKSQDLLAENSVEEEQGQEISEEYQRLFEETFGSEIKLQVQHDSMQLDYLVKLIKKIQADSSLWSLFFMAQDCSDLDLACVRFLMPNMSFDKEETRLDHVHQQRILKSTELLSLMNDSMGECYFYEVGVDFDALNRSITMLQLSNNNEKLVRLLNFILFNAFRYNDFASTIISSPSLVALLLEKADLFLIAKFVCLFGKLNEFSFSWLPFFRRLVDHPELYKTFGLLLYFHFRGTGNSKDDLIKMPLEMGCFDANEYIKLLLMEYQHEGNRWYRLWLLNSDCLARMASDVVPESLGAVLVEEIRFRNHSGSNSFSAIEDCLRAEPLFTAILQHSGSHYLLSLLQLDPAMAARIIEVCRSKIMMGVDSNLRRELIRIATMDQLIFLIGEGCGHPNAVRECLFALKGIVIQNEGRFEIILPPTVLLNLMLISEKVDPNRTIGSEWGELVASDKLLSECLLSQKNTKHIVIRSVSLLLRFFPNSAASIIEALDRNKLSLDDVLHSDLETAIDFMLSEYCVESYYGVLNKQYIKITKKQEELQKIADTKTDKLNQFESRELKADVKHIDIELRKLKSDLKKVTRKIKPFSRVLFRLFLECNELQLEALSIKCYVKIFIRGIDKYMLNHKYKICVVMPRLAAALVFCAKRDPDFVINELLQNNFLFDLIRSSSSALCLLLSSSLYRESEKLQVRLKGLDDILQGSSENSPPPLMERLDTQQGSESTPSLSAQAAAMVISRQGSGLYLRKTSSKQSSHEESSSKHSSEKRM